MALFLLLSLLSTADFGGIRDINLVGKDNLLSGGEIHPAVTGVLGTIFPSVRVSKLTPRLLGQDAIGAREYGINLNFLLAIENQL